VPFVKPPAWFVDSSAVAGDSPHTFQELGFAEFAPLAFQFVTSTYGLQPVGIDDFTARYESDLVWLAVSHDSRRSFEFDVAVDERESVTGGYTLADLIRVSDPAKAESYRNPAASTRHATSACLFRLADDLRRYGTGVLAGDRTAFVAVADAKAEFGKRWRAEAAAEKARAAARQAFDREDWATTISAYESAPSLTAADRKRLDIARRRSAP
jgi:hypothetical protein